MRSRLALADVAETAIFFLVPALFLQFYCGNWPRKFSTPVNVLIRSTIVLLGGIAIYCLYYKYGHFFLGTQKGFSHPQQFPMIPMIWLIDIWLINWWFMDGWPGWKLTMRTAEEVKLLEKEVEERAVWRGDMIPGSRMRHRLRYRLLLRSGLGTADLQQDLHIGRLNKKGTHYETT